MLRRRRGIASHRHPVKSSEQGIMSGETLYWFQEKQNEFKKGQRLPLSQQIHQSPPLTWAAADLQVAAGKKVYRTRWTLGLKCCFPKVVPTREGGARQEPWAVVRKLSVNFLGTG